MTSSSWISRTDPRGAWTRSFPTATQSNGLPNMRRTRSPSSWLAARGRSKRCVRVRCPSIQSTSRCLWAAQHNSTTTQASRCRTFCPKWRVRKHSTWQWLQLPNEFHMVAGRRISLPRCTGGLKITHMLFFQKAVAPTCSIKCEAKLFYDLKTSSSRKWMEFSLSRSPNNSADFFDLIWN